MKTCILTIEESDAILAILTELPIKYFPIVQHIQKMLQNKFLQAAALLEINQPVGVD
jgi:hypothetical protein